MCSGHRNRDRNNQEVTHNLHSPQLREDTTVYATRLCTGRPTVTHLDEQEFGPQWFQFVTVSPISLETE